MKNNKTKQILSAVLLGAICAAAIPAFAVSAASNTSVKLDGKLDEVANLSSYKITANDGKKNVTFYAALTEEGNLYLAADAYHDVYLSESEGYSWHRNTNFEFWVNGSQAWISAAGKGDREGKIYDSKMVSTEVKNGDTKYHTITEAIILKDRFTVDGDGIVKLGAAWKTPGDLLTSERVNNDDWWRTRNADKSENNNLCVTKGGIFETVDAAKASTSAGLKYASPEAVQSVDQRGKWAKSGNDYTLLDRGGLGNSFSYYGLGDSDKTVTLSATFDLSKYRLQEQGFMFAVSDVEVNAEQGNVVNEGASNYYLVDIRPGHNNVKIGIERNEKKWGGWTIDLDANGTVANAEPVVITATYKAGKIAIYLNGNLVITYADENPLTGTGYGLASKTTYRTMSNVTAKEDNSAVATEIKTTIGSTEELDALIATVNSVGKSFGAGKEFKLTADLDYTGKKFTPINDAVFTLDGDGHTISGITTTVNNAGNGNYGIIAKAMTNGYGGQGLIKNLKLKDCFLTVNGATGANVGGVIGFGDRGTATDITLNNVIVTVDGEAVVGALIGRRDWANGYENENGIKNIVFDKVTIDAPKATVGILIGATGGDAKGAVSAVTGKVCIKSANENPGIVGGDNSGFTADDTVTVEKIAESEAKVPEKPVDPVDPTKPVPPAPTGSAVVALGALAVLSLAGVAVATKKRR